MAIYYSYYYYSAPLELAMPKYRAIEVDFDIHKLIEAERRNFDESPNNVLRRLLKLGDVAPPSVELKPLATSHPDGRSWIDEGVTLPHRTLLRMAYSGRTYEGQIVDGKWVIGGKAFDSPSGAASGIALTRRGTKTRLDGWMYWHAKRPDDAEWIALDSLRPKASLTLEDLGL